MRKRIGKCIIEEEEDEQFKAAEKMHCEIKQKPTLNKLGFICRNIL